MSIADGIVSPFTEEILTPYYVNEIYSSSLLDCAGNRTITVAPLYFLPYVRIDTPGYSWTLNASGVTIRELDIFIEKALFRENENGSAMFVSAEVFQLAMNKKQETAGVKTPHVEITITHTLTGISSVCLLLSLVTYLIFQDLRSQPGINNMILCIFLTTGYILFVFGISLTELGIGCQVIGGAIHFVWVLTFFWMNVCSLHMFRVFTSSFKSEMSASPVTLTLLYLLYATFSTSTIVGINIGITFYITEGVSYGYGPGKLGLCYIYEPMLTLYTMAIPAIVLVFVNIIMFVLVVIRLRRTAEFGKRVQHERNYFSVYIKLSTLTGMAWVFAIPMMLLEEVIFNYIFIVLTCSQGIYVMIAFTCNKRVLKLYTEKLCSQRLLHNSTGTS